MADLDAQSLLPLESLLGAEAAAEQQAAFAAVELPMLLETWQTTLGWVPSDRQQQQFQQLYQAILTANRHLNLTRITEPNEFWEKHLWDSLRGILPWLGTGPMGIAEPIVPHAGLRLLDIGTGAGFPGIPIAIACPHWHMTLLDSTRKKIHFVQTTLTDLGLPQVNTLVERVETLGQFGTGSQRETYDIVTIRAVAAAAVCAEYALPLVKVGGVAILYRGQWSPEEADGLATAAAQLGGCVEATEVFTTPLSDSSRVCLYLRKIEPTPVEFPRPIGIPTQSPLSVTSQKSPYSPPPS
jgi:16S rRNA (guanine527-N7)-methyltransferase